MSAGDANMISEIFQKNYADLCSTMIDIDNLLKYFVTENIITISDEEYIKMSVSTSEKVRKLLLHISGPLQAGDPNGFYVMLKIMIKYGTKSTQQLAKSIASHVNFTDKSKPMDVQYQGSL